MPIYDFSMWKCHPGLEHKFGKFDMNISIYSLKQLWLLAGWWIGEVESIWVTNKLQRDKNVELLLTECF